MKSKSTEESASLSNWLDKHDMLERFHISARTLLKWRKMGLRCSKISGKLFFKDNDVEVFMHDHVLTSCVTQ